MRLGFPARFLRRVKGSIKDLHTVLRVDFVRVRAVGSKRRANFLHVLGSAGLTIVIPSSKLNAHG